MKKEINRFIVKEGEQVKLRKHDPAFKDGYSNEAEAGKKMEKDVKNLVKLQEKLYASGTHAMLIILQAMDAAGKDGVIKHVMSSINAQGCMVTSFRHPSDEDYEHHFFWRYNKALPQKGQIGIFNRSYYEHALICRVHPELILNEQLPGIDTVKKVNRKFWKQRFAQIRRFERNLAESGTVVLKFFLHVSKEEQRKRLLSRIETPEKNWKFNFADINEREYWDDYHNCYEEAMEATSTKEAPWYIVPADHKWYTWAVIANIIVHQLEKLHLRFPVLSELERTKVDAARVKLLNS